MRHHITEEHPFEGFTSGLIDCSSLYSYVVAYKTKKLEIRLIEIKAKNLHWIKKWHLRYRNANLELPCIVAQQKGFYRLIDGRHRMRKAIDQSILMLPCYVLEPKEILKFYQP
jgi:hypothetical protein